MNAERKRWSARSSRRLELFERARLAKRKTQCGTRSFLAWAKLLGYGRFGKNGLDFEPIDPKHFDRFRNLALIRHTVAHHMGVIRAIDVPRYQYYRLEDESAVRVDLIDRVVQLFRQERWPRFPRQVSRSG